MTEESQSVESSDGVGICDRIASVMNELPIRLAKDEHNKYKGYDYISAPALLETLRPLLAKNGLSFWMNEIGFEVITDIRSSGSKSAPWVKITYEIGVTHGDRAYPKDCECFTQMVPLLDPQSIAAAATYAQKYYFIRKFCVATGESALEVDATSNTAVVVSSSSSAESRSSSGPVSDNSKYEFVKEQILASETPDELTSAFVMSRDECSRDELTRLRPVFQKVAVDNNWSYDPSLKRFVEHNV